MQARVARNRGIVRIGAAVRQTFVGAGRKTAASGARGAVAAVIVALGLVAASIPHAHSRSTQVTWTRDVAPIVEARCVRCHRADGFAPMSLSNYADAKPWAAAMRAEVLSRRMPPWPAAAGYGDFANDASLSPIESELIARWADGGAPLGSEAAVVPAHAPAADAAPLRIELPPVALPGAALVTAPLAVAIPRERWLTGWAFEPGARRLVEQATLLGDGTAIASWTPFDDRVSFAAGTGERLRSGASLAVAVRYRKTSEAAIDASAVQLFFGDAPARQRHHVTIGCGPYVFDRAVDLLAVKPAARRAGDEVEVIAFAHDGAVTPLSVIGRYRPEYAITYRLRTPLRLHAGERVEARSPAGCDATLDFVNR